MNSENDPCDYLSWCGDWYGKKCTQKLKKHCERYGFDFISGPYNKMMEECLIPDFMGLAKKLKEDCEK